MNTFKPGDRVRYEGNSKGLFESPDYMGLEGTVEEYRSKNDVTVLFDVKGARSCYAANLRLVKTEPKAGDRVTVTITGEVKTVGKYVIVWPDGCNSRGDGANHVDPTLAGVTVEVIEPEYKPGAVVKDASGVYWQRTGAGRWITFGDPGGQPHDVPTRPLAVVP